MLVKELNLEAREEDFSTGGLELGKTLHQACRRSVEGSRKRGKTNGS
jgi:hypothetical protein